MHDALASTLSNPASGWLSQWQSGWNSTPAASGSGSPHDTGMILLILVVVIATAVISGLRRMAR
jgi:hypothetical protein